MLLNCDLGEGMAYDEEIIPLVDMANLACGMHAGSPELMSRNILRVRSCEIEIGAHPSYPDRDNFGRVSMDMGVAELRSVIIYQISALDGLCKSHDVKMSYVKPHGALYNDMMANPSVYKTILESIARYDKSLKLMILSSPQNSSYAKLASKYGIELIYELFADRNYTDEGGLVPRSQENAVIESVEEIVSRIKKYKKSGELESIHRKKLHLEGDSLCVHGDNLESLEIIKALRAIL